MTPPEKYTDRYCNNDDCNARSYGVRVDSNGRIEDESCPACKETSAEYVKLSRVLPLGSGAYCTCNDSGCHVDTFRGEFGCPACGAEPYQEQDLYSVPVSNCNDCGIAVYTTVGFCGGCQI